MPEFFELAQVVGTWFQCHNERQPASVTGSLAELGFHWNKRRLAWQHPYVAFNPAERKDPRKKYATTLFNAVFASPGLPSSRSVQAKSHANGMR